MNKPCLQLNDISLGFGGDPLFSDLSLVIHSDDRLALVGRNGSGKSTLLKVMAGLVEPDTGDRVVPTGTSVGYLPQDPSFDGFDTLGDYAANDLPQSEFYKVESAAAELDLDLTTKSQDASGGERRRAALARLLAQDHDVLLLDEPTNHLDISTIHWLERHLAASRTAFVLISHDRAFLNALTQGILWVDRGQVRRLRQGFAAFEDWRDKTWEEEDENRHKLNRKIKAETKWSVEGISGRRKRNMGRMRALQDLRAERAAMIKRQTTAELNFSSGQKSGKKVIDAKSLSLSFGDRKIINNFSLTVHRGNRIALVGPNGAGKTSLLNLLLKHTNPDQGTVAHGTHLDISVFDQTRAQLTPNLSLWETLTNDPTMAVAGKNDQVMVRGTPRHVMGYLKDFLFAEEQARAPVRSLSGGEKARLLLARLMARESNVLVLDEPTNDLDVETLDLLQDILGDYDGTVLFVSHDRDFIDRLADTTLGFDGRGNITVFAGGWSDNRKALLTMAQADAATPAAPKPKTAPKPKAKPAPAKLSYKETYRLEHLPTEIDRLSAEIAKLEGLLSDPNLFTENPVKFQKATEALSERQTLLSQAEDEWLMLEEKAAGGG